MIYISDDEFIREEVPMTKEEVRILSISKMRLKENYRVLDIGAGTGSISIQVAKICTKGQVIAIEKEDRAVKLINKNKKKFNAINLQVLSGEGCSLYDDIVGEFDSIFIGGSGGNIKDIIKKYTCKLKKGGRIVLNFITLDNVYKALESLKELNYKTEFMQVSISKSYKNTYMLKGNNPIFIVWAEKNI